MADPQWSSPSASWAISSIATATARMTAIVFARGDFDAVCVAQRQPVLRYAGDRIVSAAELVLVVQDAPLGDDILVPLHVDREPVAERREPRLADRGDGGARTQDVHALAQGELLLADRRHLAALQILQHEGIVQAHDLPVDPEDRVSMLVRDVEILADRDEPLLHRVACHVRPPIPLRRQASTAARARRPCHRWYVPQRRHRRNWPCSRPPAGFPAPGSVSPSPRRGRPYLRLLALKSLAKGGRGARFFRPAEAGAEQRFLMGSPTSSPTERGAASSQPHGAVVE